MQQMLKRTANVLSLAQGIVHWPPPAEAADAAARAAADPASTLYGPDEGTPELRDALRSKLARANNLKNSDVMVTAGANQGYVNAVLALIDAGDAALLYRPYYFNHLMALQMTGSAAELVLPASLPDLQPDVGALRAELEGRAANPDKGRQLKLVTLVNPGNPTGVMVPEDTLRVISKLCARYGVWLLVDNTYEHFAYADDEPHACVEGDHVINLFSFSKAYGMMGYRVGYVAHPPALGAALLKVQDTIAICPAMPSQATALGALQAGSEWVVRHVSSLDEQKALVLDALAPLGAGAVHGGSGAIYLFVRLPPSEDGAPMDDVALVRWMAERHGVALIPGSACGMPGHVRVCYANLTREKTREAAARLKEGFRELVQDGMVGGARFMAANEERH